MNQPKDKVIRILDYAMYYADNIANYKFYDEIKSMKEEIEQTKLDDEEMIPLWIEK